MNSRALTVAMNGVTGRMGTNQHFIRSILAIMKQGGVKCSDGTTLQVKPILTGRNEAKLRHLAHHIASSVIDSHVDYSTDVDQVFADSATDIVFDASGTLQRAGVIAKAVEYGKAVYCEKPIATDLQTATRIADQVEAAGIKNGVVQDKLWLPEFANCGCCAIKVSLVRSKAFVLSLVIGSLRDMTLTSLHSDLHGTIAAKMAAA